MIDVNEDLVSASLERVNTLMKWRGASFGAPLCGTDAQILRLRVLAAELYALYADADGQPRHSPARDRKITGTICELLRLNEAAPQVRHVA